MGNKAGDANEGDRDMENSAKWLQWACLLYTSSATDGEAYIDGVNVLENPMAAKKKIGYLPEMPPLYSDMTVDEYLRFVCDIKKIPTAKHGETIAQVAKLARISDVQKRLIKNLSKGYKQIQLPLSQALPVLSSPQPNLTTTASGWSAR